MAVKRAIHSRLHRERTTAPAKPTAGIPGRGYGWVPDRPDKRDEAYRFDSQRHVTLTDPLPNNSDLRSQCPVVYDQGQLGSCTANAIAGAIQFDRRRQKLPDWTPSRLFIYYNERAMERTINSDAGAMIRDGVKSVNKQGAPPETDWPYNIRRFKSRPTVKAYTDAAQHKSVIYRRIDRTLADMQSCLAGGIPFVFGFTVYSAFESDQVANTGVLNMPNLKTESVLGGHAVLAVGFDNKTGRFIVRNSWSASWGMAGYFTVPYDYLLDSDLSDDMWMITTVQ